MKNYYDCTGGKMFDALRELDQSLSDKDIKPFDIDVIGGFALMIHNLRERDDSTDINYIGEDLAADIKEISARIGQKYGLDENWINNDMFNKSLEDVEYTTGKLHFFEAFKLNTITVNVLDERDLLRLKIMVIDDAVTCLAEGKNDVFRSKDFKDVSMLLKRLNISLDEAFEEDKKYVLNDNTKNLIKNEIDKLEFDRNER